MKYSFCFLLLSGLICAGAWKLGFWGLPLYGLGWNFALLAFAYAFNRPSLLGKSGASLRLWARVLWAPYLILNHCVWHLYRIAVSENAFDSLGDLILSRRLLSQEYPPNLVNLVDLTAEFSESLPGYEINYIALPILDASVPQLERAFAAIHQLKPGPTLIHCAQGHGRTGLFAALLLFARGDVTTVDEALARLKAARPGIGLNKKQRAFLESAFRTELDSLPK